MRLWLFAIKHWQPLLLALLVAVICGGLWLHIRNDNQTEWALVQAKVEQAALAEANAALASALEAAQASAQAAQAARDRNDEVIPRIRRESAGRVERASGASAADSVQLGTEAAAAYGAARNRLRAKSAR